MKPLFLPGDIVTVDDSFYWNGPPKPKLRYTVTGYSNNELRDLRPMVTLKRISKSGKPYYDTYHQDWLELVTPVKR